MKDRRMLGAEALDQSGYIGQRRVPAAGADRRSGRHEVALCRDAEESRLTLFGHAVVRHFDPSYACQPTAFPRPMIIVCVTQCGLQRDRTTGKEVWQIRTAPRASPDPFPFAVSGPPTCWP